MADNINKFVDNLQLNSLNSLTHLLNTEDTDELNVIRHSPYISDDELLQSRLPNTNGLGILSLNCQVFKQNLIISKYSLISSATVTIPSK